MSNPASKTYLFIVNNAPYGNERLYNALRLAKSMPAGIPKIIRPVTTECLKQR